MKIKTTPTGQIEKFKSRLVAQGFTQVPGKDFTDTYAPISIFTTFRTLMAIAASLNLQCDVKNVFLYGNFKTNTTIYVRRPKGYQDGTARV